MRDSLRFLWALMVIATLTVLSAILGGAILSCGNPVALYGPPPTNDDGGSPDGCIPKALYGPRPCMSDADCVTRNGAGWYCRTVDSGPDGCGNRLSWPTCVQGTGDLDAGAPARDASCESVMLYGPPSCTTNDDCAKWYGAGWYCDQGSAVSNGCTVAAWPMCKQGVVDAGSPALDASCGPIALYGPVPCQNDSDCDGGVCDRTHSNTDQCGREYVWPICK